MNAISMQQQYVVCSNCGCSGHVHRKCVYPITSYGIICFTIDAWSGKLQYLMVQRKDSLSYVEFLRGKYSLNKTGYIKKLLSNMTAEERQKVLVHEFEQLWSGLWRSDRYRINTREYQDAKYKFDTLKRGFFNPGSDNNNGMFSLGWAITHTISTLEEQEWGFPKGRRNTNEHDLMCAIREFKEETSMCPKLLRLIKLQPYEEVFVGSNNIRYRHVYFLAYACNKQDNLYNPLNKVQSREIKNVCWFNYRHAQSKIRCMNIERKELFRRVHHTICKHIVGIHTCKN